MGLVSGEMIGAERAAPQFGSGGPSDPLEASAMLDGKIFGEHAHAGPNVGQVNDLNHTRLSDVDRMTFLGTKNPVSGPRWEVEAPWLSMCGPWLLLDRVGLRAKFTHTIFTRIF